MASDEYCPGMDVTSSLYPVVFKLGDIARESGIGRGVTVSWSRVDGAFVMAYGADTVFVVTVSVEVGVVVPDGLFCFIPVAVDRCDLCITVFVGSHKWAARNLFHPLSGSGSTSEYLVV